MNTYRDIIDRMERNGDCSAAQDYKDALREHGHSEYERADRHNPADGAQYTYAGDRAEEAYRSLRRDEERREEERLEEQRWEEERAREQYERHRCEQEENLQEE